MGVHVSLYSGETRRAKQERNSGLAYTEGMEVEPSDEKFKIFAESLLENQPWIGKTEGGMNQAGEI